MKKLLIWLLLAAPASANEISSLAHSLTANCHTEEQKARALYKWETAHIAYDGRAFQANAQLDGSAEATLRTRWAVCEGYARLYEALARASGLEAVTVPGIGKGFGFEPDGKPTENHAWNAVRIDGRWRLLDSCWGSGYLDDHYRFHRRYDPEYFLTPPERFALGHFPTDPRFQLLAPAWTESQFLSLVAPAGEFYHLGLRLVSHHRAILKSSQTLTVVLEGPPDLHLKVQLRRGGRPDYLPCTLVTREGTRFVIKARFPTAATYQMIVFAGPVKSRLMHSVLEYRIQAQATSNFNTYPVAFEPFQDHDSRLLEPDGGVLRAHYRHRFRIRVPGAISVKLQNRGKQTDLRRVGEEWVGTLAPGVGTLEVYAKFHPGTMLDGLLQYQVKAW